MYSGHSVHLTQSRSQAESESQAESQPPPFSQCVSRSQTKTKPRPFPSAAQLLEVLAFTFRSLCVGRAPGDTGVHVPDFTSGVLGQDSRARLEGAASLLSLLPHSGPAGWDIPRKPILRMSDVLALERNEQEGVRGAAAAWVTARLAGAGESITPFLGVFQAPEEE